jgi:hypothetical protein
MGAAAAFPIPPVLLSQPSAHVPSPPHPTYIQELGALGQWVAYTCLYQWLVRRNSERDLAVHAFAARAKGVGGWVGGARVCFSRTHGNVRHFSPSPKRG